MQLKKFFLLQKQNLIEQGDNSKKCGQSINRIKSKLSVLVYLAFGPTSFRIHSDQVCEDIRKIGLLPLFIHTLRSVSMNVRM